MAYGRITFFQLLCPLVPSLLSPVLGTLLVQEVPRRMLPSTMMHDA